ncbi:hypothetical protein [Demequina activiva]|uniref:Uncharacterized protein n=1 Tax=Demequina activiva TaxID=1582364 RepID=A0A919UFR3_9MICO|nr:hypothetical protein [Demequina activiva]GIG53997.1 hypothetical protein Dac01nite_07490 [Demequina activiva]
MPTVSATFTVDRTVVDDANPRVQLQFVVSDALPYGTEIRIWDGSKVTNYYSCTLSAGGCLVSSGTKVPEDATVTYHAYLTSSPGWDGALDRPTGDFVDLGAITVRHAGYSGSITEFSSSRVGENYYGTPAFRLSLSLSVPVNSYRATIVDVTRNRLLSNCGGAGTDGICNDWEYFSSGIRV